VADNISITAGSGKDVATDEVTGTLEHVQLMKLAYSANGSKTLLTADAFGLSVAPYSGRSADLRFYATAVAAGATTVETAITLTKSSGTSATSSAVSFAPTSGKRFHIEAIRFAARGHDTATKQSTIFSLRVNTAGAVVTTSTPIILQVRVPTEAVANQLASIVVPIGHGIEITGDGTLEWGVTAAATYTTNAPTWDVTIIGFEY